MRVPRSQTPETLTRRAVARRPLPEGEVSEYEFQPELDLPRGRGRLRNHARRWADLSAVENHLSRVREIGVIQDVEDLGSELHI